MTKAAHWVGLSAGILVMSAGLAIPAHSQQTSERAIQGSQGQAGAAKKPAKPATAKPATAKSPDMRVPQTRQWTLDDALPSRNPARATPTVTSPELGRVPVQGGTFGFSTETKVDPYRTPDGNRIRGLENTSRSDPSYLGLSLSVTTDDRTFLPRTILPNW